MMNVEFCVSYSHSLWNIIWLSCFCAVAKKKRRVTGSEALIGRGDRAGAAVGSRLGPCEMIVMGLLLGGRSLETLNLSLFLARKLSRPSAIKQFHNSITPLDFFPPRLSPTNTISNRLRSHKQERHCLASKVPLLDRPTHTHHVDLITSTALRHAWRFVQLGTPSRPPVQANAKRQGHPRHQLRPGQQQRL